VIWKIYCGLGIAILLTAIAALIPGRQSETLFLIALAAAVLMLGGSLLAYPFQEQRLRVRRKNRWRAAGRRTKEKRHPKA
jgi:peptidoglycan/LPS O-acetylase OafA/YrhL